MDEKMSVVMAIVCFAIIFGGIGAAAIMVRALLPEDDEDASR